MGDKTGIAWTEATWNATTGCDRVSSGCDHCYAMTMAARLKKMGADNYQADGDPRTSGPGFGITEHPHMLDKPLRWTRPRRIFVNSMSDLFHDGVSDDFVARVFAVMALAPQHTFQVLTKRHARMRSLLKGQRFREAVEKHMELLVRDGVARGPAAENVRGRIRAWLPLTDVWPLPNVWLGVSAEDQRWADIRVPALLDTPAAVRFVSAEPLLGPIRLFGDAEQPGPGDIVTPYSNRTDYGTGVEHDVEVQPGLDWVIVGGESGRDHRPLDLDWARSLRDQCDAAGVTWFFKQVGGLRPGDGGHMLDGVVRQDFPDGSVS